LPLGPRSSRYAARAAWLRLGLPVTWGNSGVADSTTADSFVSSVMEAGMGQVVGLDVSVKGTSVCVVDDVGTIVHEAKVKSTPAAIAREVRQYAPDAIRVGVRVREDRAGCRDRCIHRGAWRSRRGPVGSVNLNPKWEPRRMAL